MNQRLTPREDQMTTAIVVAMHGSPPKDFPRRELAEFFGLHGRLEFGGAEGKDRAPLERRFRELDAMMREWPRNSGNDPFHTASHELAAELASLTGLATHVGFNEFCAPSVGEALDRAVSGGAEDVLVVTPMLTRGGEHAEADIPAAIERATERHPDVQFAYVWPFESRDVAAFLEAQLAARSTSGKDEVP